jgi:uncharacterized protein
MATFLAILIGILGGISGGLFGIGGGIVLVPAMILLLGFSQHKAQGTSLLALLLPVGIFGVIEYNKAGNVDLRNGLFIALGFLGGNYLGSKVSLAMDELLLRRCFAGFLVLVAIQLFLKK